VVAAAAAAVAVAAVLTRGRQIIPLPAAATITIAAMWQPGDQASGGYGSGNSGGNAGSSPPSSTPSGPSQAEINERNRINRERAQAEADRREAQDQAIRDQIERDRAAQEEADRRERNRAIVMGSQLPANNVYAGTTTANDSTLGGQSIQELTQKAKTMGLTVKQGEGGLVLVDLTGQEVGKLSDINAIIGAVDNSMENPAETTGKLSFGIFEGSYRYI
jgi:hypothetical protein